jgi:hypothetical protein
MAADVAAVHGVKETADRLHLNANRLLQWMETAPRSAPVAGSPFVELGPLPFAVPPECTLELEEPSGRTLRISLKGEAITQALALGELLWRGRR